MARLIQCSCLTDDSGIGNQLFRFAFAKAYAEKMGAVLQIPKNWIGRAIFNLRDVEEIKKPLPKTACDWVHWGEVDIDLFGYFQYQNCIDLLSRKKLKEWFAFHSDYRYEKYQEGQYVGVHLRRGDYVTKHSDKYCIVSGESYWKALRKFRWDNHPILFRSDWNNPQMTPSLDWLADFQILMNSAALFRANSTFSWWAGVLGNCRVFSPVVGDLKGWNDVHFVDGNYPKMASMVHHPNSKLTDLHLPD